MDIKNVDRFPQYTEFPSELLPILDKSFAGNASIPHAHVLEDSVPVPNTSFNNGAIFVTYEGIERENADRIAQAANISFSLASGISEDGYNFERLSANAEALGSYQLVESLQNKQGSWVPSRDVAAGMLQNHSSYLGRKFMGILGYQNLYTSAFDLEGNQLTFPSEQMQGTLNETQTEIAKVIRNVKDKGWQTFPSYIKSPFARGRSLMNSTPISLLPLDLDSGFCDFTNNTAFYMGQRVHVLPIDSDTPWVVVFDRGQMSFLPKDMVVSLADYRNQHSLVTWLGTQPKIMRIGSIDFAIFPGDVLIEENGTIKIDVGDRHYAFDKSIMPDIHKRITLDQALKWVRNLNMIYTPNTDCSTLIKKFMEMLGVNVPRAMSDISDYLSGILKLETTDIYGDCEPLSEVTPGCYIVEMYVPPKSPEGVRESRHGYIVEVEEDGRMQAHSQAFTIVGDSGEVEYPIGSHTCTEDSFKYYLSQGRGFKFIKVGEPRN